MVKTRWLAALGLMLLLVPSARAADPNGIEQEALDRAHNFLVTEARGRTVINLVHFGTKYKKHQFKEVKVVTDAQGKVIRGEFFLVYSFDWDQGGTSDIGFFCDRRGNVKGVKVVETNALFAQPFLGANATIKVLGSLVKEALKDKLTDADKMDLQKAVDDADARKLLELSLQFQQTFGR